MRPAYLQIDLGAVAHNLTEVRRLVGPERRLIAVVKADAYGHGAVPVAKACLQAGADLLAVALLEEGLALREAGITAEILVMGPMLPSQAADLVAADLTATAMDFDFAYALSTAAQARGRAATAHLKVDTGMSRLGVRLDDLAELSGRLRPLPALRWAGIFSHLAAADDPDYSAAQAESFTLAAQVAKTILGPLPYLHLCSSPGICLYPDYAFSAVRPGEMLYGLLGGVPSERRPDLREAMALHAPLAFLKRLSAGEKVSYGCTWEAPRDTTVAVVPVGYADGYPRALSGTGAVLIGGQRRPIVGRVCMDCFMVDVGLEPACQVGDPVVIFGRQGEAEVSIAELSALAGTINQEFVSRMGARLPRVHVDAPA